MLRDHSPCASMPCAFMTYYSLCTITYSLNPCIAYFLFLSITCYV